MLAVLFVTLIALTAPQGQKVVEGGPPPAPVPQDAPKTLPATPQGKRVQAYMDAFNSGDEARFLKVQEEMMAPEVLARRTPEQRAKMFARLKGDFPRMTVLRAVAGPNQIRAVVPTGDGHEAIFSFDFEPKAPHRITGIGIDIGNIER
jgi:hypothetical protein